MFIRNLLLVLSQLAAVALSSFNDNEIIGDPKVECLSHMVSVNFVTKQPFQGHVFIRGHYADTDCRKDYVLNRDTTGFMDVTFEKCGMRRLRTANPKGMSMTAVVIVSFHRQFITHKDRAYHVECFYLEEQKVVQSELHVSMISTTELSLQPPMPTCKYAVLKDGPGGERMSYARVGDSVFHQWSCDYPMPDMYCMLVHSCTVDDGETALYDVVDERGCPVDRVILGEIGYKDDLTAGTQAQVFKFADRAHVYFTCQVKLSLKKEEKDGTCQKPACSEGENSVRRRFLRSTKSERTTVGENFDLIAPPVLVLDMDDLASAALASPRENLSRYDLVPSFASDTQGVCMSELSFGFLLSATLISALTATLFAAVHAIQYRMRQEK